jgi:hypothetical protein
MVGGFALVAYPLGLQLSRLPQRPQESRILI